MTDLMFERANSEISIEESKVQVNGENFSMIEVESESGLGGMTSPSTGVKHRNSLQMNNSSARKLEEDMIFDSSYQTPKA